MSSTEFTIGLNGTKNSSKVLRPPGGGSSDIFGMGSRVAGKPTTGKEESTDTQDRLFGIQSVYTPSKPQEKTNVVEPPCQVDVVDPPSQVDVMEPPSQVNVEPLSLVNVERPSQVIPKATKKQIVRRNPITGEELVYAGNDETGESDKPDINAKIDENIVLKSIDVEEKKADIPIRQIQTSIRVRNPPGGKSSGIF